MAKFFNENYDEVEAFTKEEVEAKIAEASKKAEAEFKKQLEEKENALTEKTSEYEKLSKKYDSRKDEYENLKKKFEETGENLNKTAEERKQAFEKMRDDMIKKSAGEDKEYAETLRAQFDRIGKETLDPTELEASLKDAHALAMNQLSRDFTPFTMNGGATGEAPRVKSEEGASFTETPIGKNTLDHILVSLGNDPAKITSTPESK